MVFIGQKILLLSLLFLSLSASARVDIGAKFFTESVVLSEILRQKLLDQGVDVGSVRVLGGTSFVWKALKRGEIDIYPDYVGTLKKEIFSKRSVETRADLAQSLKAEGMAISDSLGFANSYALGIKRKRAAELGITKISDLRKFPELSIKVSHEFLARRDGMRALVDYYDLQIDDISAIEHILAFQALNNGDVDVTDVYLTEAELKIFDIRVLDDDLGFFPNYDAVFVYKEDLIDSCPECIEVIRELENSISQERMIEMNRQVSIGTAETEVARKFLHLQLIATDDRRSAFMTRINRIIKRSEEHLILVFFSMSFAAMVGVSLGVLSYRSPQLGRAILLFVSILQTVPSLALLVFMIPLFGIGTKPALVALFLYALLPMVRGTLSGLSSIDRAIIESAKVIGLSSLSRLVKIEMPIASPHILSGIKTSTVITVGTATLGALIGAGGYGNPILTGIRMHDMSLIFEGAIPAAVLAILCQGLFYLLDKVFIPKGLRIVGQSASE